MAIKPVQVGIIGCGNISGTYFTHCKELETLEVVACSDIIPERAKASAEKFGIPHHGTNEVVLDNPDIELVICLTPPKVHAEIMLDALAAGKNAYTEKPFGICKDEGQAILSAARARGLRVGGAPDTFLGAGIQTCRKLIDDGAIGRPVAAVAFMMGRGAESWHPDPEFFYERGGGPMLDMGPYYLTTLVNLLGSIRRVTGSARASFPERLITSEKKRGKRIVVETPTHITGTAEFANGAIATLVMSFDIKAHNLPCIQVYGSEGTLSVPDPNGFGGPVRIDRGKGKGWEDVKLINQAYADQSRGIGPADLAMAIRTGRKARASGALAYHVLEAMVSFEAASRSGRHVELASTCDRPAAMPPKLKRGKIDQ